MVRYTITPWRHQSDLLEVRRQLYNLSPDHPDARRHAVDRVLAWKLRGNLPHAVESTALLVDAQLHHFDGHSNSSWSLRAVYAAAFTRFVTGFCDIGRAREGRLGGGEASMLQIAAQIGMPAEFVGLRHEATHEELPSLKRLVSATQQALNWLWRVYWAGLDEGAEVTGGAANAEALKEEVRVQLKAVRSARRDAFKAKKQKSIEHYEQMTGFARSLQDVCQEGGQRDLSVVADVLVGDKLLFPSNRGLGDPMQPAFLLWDDLIAHLMTIVPDTFLEALAERLVTALSDPSRPDRESDVDAEALSLWLLHLLGQRSSHKGNDRPATIAMRHCCLYPGFWTQRLGHELLQSGCEEFQERWRDLFAASTLASNGGASGDASVIIDPPAPGRSDAAEAERRIAESDDTVGAPGGWRRAPLPPSVPIGVIA